MNKDKEYIVDAKVNVELTAEEKEALRKKTKPVGTTLAYGRQNVFTDRRDPLAVKKVQTERRKSKKDRRDQDD